MRAPSEKILVKTDKNERLKKDLGGTEIIIAEGWNPFSIETNVPYGEVIDVADDVEQDIRVGDKMYGHHFLVNNEVEAGIHWQLAKDVVCIIRDGEMIMMNDWNFLLPVSAEEKTDSGIFISSKQGDREDRAVVAHASDMLNEMGIEEGMTVYYRKDCDKIMEVEGEKYFRTRSLDILGYVPETV